MAFAFNNNSLYNDNILVIEAIVQYKNLTSKPLQYYDCTKDVYARLSSKFYEEIPEDL
jgi:hypothetical protein